MNAIKIINEVKAHSPVDGLGCLSYTVDAENVPESIRDGLFVAAAIDAGYYGDMPGSEDVIHASYFLNLHYDGDGNITVITFSAIIDFTEMQGESDYLYLSDTAA